MRVTNEQAEEIRDGFFQTLIVSRDYNEAGNEKRITAGELAADLLEARNLIKEYCQVGKEVVAWNVSYKPLIDLLERTKGLFYE